MTAYFPALVQSLHKKVAGFNLRINNKENIYRHKYKKIGCGFIACFRVILLIVYVSWFCVLVFLYLFACLFSSWSFMFMLFVVSFYIVGNIYTTVFRVKR